MRAIALTLLVVLTSLTTSPVNMVMTGSKVATVQLGSIRSGAAIKSAYYDRSQSTIVEGSNRLKVSVGDPGAVRSLHVMGAGYVLRVAGKARDRLVLVRRDGRRRELNHRGSVYGIAVSSDGRFLAWSTGLRSSTVVTVLNPSTGRHVVRVERGKAGFRVVGLGSNRALVDDHGDARWWQWQRGKMTLASRWRPLAVDITTGVFATVHPAYAHGGYIRDPKAASWGMGEFELPSEFSQDHRWVASSSSSYGSSLRQRARVRRVTNGYAPLVVNAKLPAGAQVRFESTTAMLVPVVEVGKGRTRSAVVRCYFAGSKLGRCERATAVLTRTGATPPTSNWLLASPRTR
ncbi:MAG: hypothetical protein V9E81_15370 [Marmoricola sp.]